MWPCLRAHLRTIQKEYSVASEQASFFIDPSRGTHRTSISQVTSSAPESHSEGGSLRGSFAFSQPAVIRDGEGLVLRDFIGDVVVPSE